MKIFCMLLLVLVALSGCTNDPENIVNSLQGNWTIVSSYTAVKKNRNLKQKTKTDYTGYELSITPNGDVLVSQYTEWEILGIGSGTVKGKDRMLLFDENPSVVLNSMAPDFEIPFPAMEYKVAKYTGAVLEINYAFVTDEGEVQYEGFLLKRK